MLAGAGHPGAPAAAAAAHAAARVRGPAPARRGRHHDHRQPQPARRQRLQALPRATARRSCRPPTLRSRPPSAAIGPLSQVPVAAPDSPLISRCGDEVAPAYLDKVCAISPALAATRPGCGSSIRRCTGWRAGWRCARSSRPGFPAPDVVHRPGGAGPATSRRSPSPTRGAGRAGPGPGPGPAVRRRPGDRQRPRRRPAGRGCARPRRAGRLADAHRRPGRRAARVLPARPGHRRSGLGTAAAAAGSRAPGPAQRAWWCPRSCRPRCWPGSRRRPARSTRETLTGFKWIVRAARASPGSPFRLRLRGGARLRGG